LTTILLIDEDVALLSSLSSALSESGYAVITTSDLAHARQLHASERPDLVVLEVRSEREQGWELLNEIAVDTPTMVLSAAALEEDVVRGLEAGASDYIAKPYRTRELLARVRARLSALALSSSAPAEHSSRSVSTGETSTTAITESLEELPPSVLTAAAIEEPNGVTADPAPAPPPTEAVAPIEPAVAPIEPVVEPVVPTSPAARENPMPEWVQQPVQRIVPEPRRGRNRQEEEQVFISDAEEMKLLREPVTQTTDSLGPPKANFDEQPRSIGQRLRNERMRRHLTLVQIENETRVRISYLQAIEDDKFTLIPRGPASQQMVKAYADYLGLDTAAILDEFRKLYYVEANEPLRGLGGATTSRSIPRWVLFLVAFLLALVITLGVIFYFDPLFFVRIGSWFGELWGWVQGLGIRD
jgi:CheY-like chemotaxis protein/transcriptional regulator with XRE-family HTH domain